MAKDEHAAHVAEASAAAARTATLVIGWRIAQPEYDRRVANVRRALETRRLDALVLFHPI